MISCGQYENDFQKKIFVKLITHTRGGTIDNLMFKLFDNDFFKRLLNT